MSDNFQYLESIIHKDEEIEEDVAGIDEMKKCIKMLYD